MFVEKKTFARGCFRGATSQSARYGYRCFRNAPKKQLKLQKSLSVIDTAEIQNSEFSNDAVSSIPKPISNPNLKEEGNSF